MRVHHFGGNFYGVSDLQLSDRFPNLTQLWCHLGNGDYIVYVSDVPIKRGSKHHRNIKRFFRYSRALRHDLPVPATRVISAGKFWRFYYG